MNRKTMRMVAGANLIAGCLLLQGCNTFTQRSEIVGVQAAGDDLPPLEVQPLEPLAPEFSVAPVTPLPQPVVQIPSVQDTTSYTIQKGDTISAVAYKYGMRWQDVVAINPGISPNQLRPGQVIQLPGIVDLSDVRRVPVVAPRARAARTTPPVAAPARPAAGGKDVLYTVKSGDSLSVIAYRHGIKTAALREANKIKGDKIIVGQKLKVPGATKTPAATASAATKSAAARPATPKTTPPKTSVAADKPRVEVKPVAEAPKPVVVESEPVVLDTTPPPAAAQAATAPAAAAGGDTDTYVVADGEDLYAVAIRWGVSPSELKALNNLQGADLKPGTVLRIPGGTSR